MHTNENCYTRVLQMNWQYEQRREISKRNSYLAVVFKPAKIQVHFEELFYHETAEKRKRGGKKD